jgi:hypothetical protein
VIRHFAAWSSCAKSRAFPNPNVFAWHRQD